MIVIVANTESRIDYGSQPGGRPSIVGKAVNDRALREDIGDHEELFPGEAARTSGGAPLLKRLDPLLPQGPIPPRSCGAANTKLAGNA